ncbi:hypothetical protein Afil01_33420 [Actinorhabdospora filicis]|uniref:eCIS core domain-containing protein n=1 Tax=Actinorhabdospora filicis TaxID=1785913 RepID=A0A9W6SK74_9ACTN|nr:DUF4157 domain-containing protein [Actinorhabdospora filicis]GLZ78535.1 hypothetical protein Afil01_33420 [Actinorhabdospora filicis]
MTNHPARPLPRSVRVELEEAFGADLADVRVRESALPADGPRAMTRGETVHFAPGAYDPSSPAGREVLAHEIAHVLQQRFGRVRHGAEDALEAEAIIAGRVFAAGRTVGVPRGTGARPTPATQYYTVGQAAALGVAVVNGAHNAPTNAQDSFISQRKGGAAAANAGTFLQPGGAVNLESANPAGVTLRLSANGNMAVQDADATQRQPKVFYATQAIVDESNLRLTLLNSNFRLATDPPGAAQRRITNGAAVLLRVTPRNVATATAGLTMTAEQSCNSLFDAVVGGTAPLGPQPSFLQPLNPVPHALVEYHVARELLSPPKPPYLDDTSAVNRATSMRAIAVGFAQRSRGALPAFVADLQQYGVNEYAAPAVGEGFVTCSLLATALGAGVAPAAVPPTYQDFYQVAAGGGPQTVAHARSWTSHYGGVIARDGADVVTLENYARNAEDALAATDTRYYFQMYDTNPPAGGARSWHHTWANTPMQAIAGGAGPATHEPVSPGTRGFTNPITFAVSAPDDRYNAIATATHGGAVLNTIKTHHNQVAGAPDAHQEMLEALKGLQFANVHLAAGTAGDAVSVDGWRAALHAALIAARFRGNHQGLAHAFARVVKMKRV